MYCCVADSAQVFKQGQGRGLAQFNQCSEFGDQDSMGVVSFKEKVGTVGDFKEAFCVY